MKALRCQILALTLALIACPVQAKDIDLKKSGAKADGKTKVTKVLQKAIDDVSAAGGGRVTLSGGTFVSGSIELKSGVELYIDADEAVKFEGIRNIWFTDVHARSLCGAEIFSPEEHPFENLVFTNCSFTKVAPEEFKMNEDTRRRRAKMGDGDTRGSRIEGVKGLTLNNTIFKE